MMPRWVITEGGFRDCDPNIGIHDASIKFAVMEDGGIQIKMEANGFSIAMPFTLDAADDVADYLKGVITAQRVENYRKALEKRPKS